MGRLRGKPARREAFDAKSAPTYDATSAKAAELFRVRFLVPPTLIPLCGLMSLVRSNQAQFQLTVKW